MTLIQFLLMVGFICFCYGLECNDVTGRINPACNCHVYENGDFIFDCPDNLSKSTYLSELDDLEEALTIKFPGNCDNLPSGCKCGGETFEIISVECPASAFSEVIKSISGFYMYDLQFICTDDEKIPKINTQFPKFWTRSIGFIGCDIEEIREDTFWNIRGLVFLMLSFNKLTHIGSTIIPLRELRYVYLDGNQLTQIQKEMFPINIQSINLNDNPINKIDVDAFDDLKDLEELRLPLIYENIIPDGLFKMPIERLIIRGISNQNKIICTKWLLHYLIFNGVNIYFEEWFSKNGLYCSENGLYGGQKIDNVLKNLSTKIIIAQNYSTEKLNCSYKAITNLMMHQEEKIYRTMTPLEYVMDK